MKILTLIKCGATAVITSISYFLGGFDGLLYTLAVFVGVDYASGVIAAIVEKKLSSRTGFLGIIKKVCIFLVIAVANSLGNVTGIDALRDLTVSFYIANEGISLLENLSRIGVPFPEKLINILKQLKEEE